MRNVDTDPQLKELRDRVLFYANEMGRTLPEMRFFILNSTEFLSLLEKYVYPTSPVNLWEGKRVSTRKHRIESGQESSIYYEVVQTGNPSYAYLNDTNSAMMQASVMAHVVGHCEFSELNVLKDSNQDRTEFVMYLSNKVEMGRQQMGEQNYMNYWNAVESVTPLIARHSQYNLANSVETDKPAYADNTDGDKEEQEKPYFSPISTTLDRFLKEPSPESVWEKELKTKANKETLSRQGYKLFAPCQDILGFLKEYAPTSVAERAVLDYLYTVHATHEFVIRTQIMNEGWAMYWEKKIMLELFKEKAVDGIIDYAKVFSGVCYPRPYYMRNPYHLGFHMWNHIEEMYRDGKISIEYMEETDQKTKDEWKDRGTQDPIDCMGQLVRTMTDYEFLRRFLTNDLIHEFHLNRFHRMEAQRLGIGPEDIVQQDANFVWVNPEPIKPQMLSFFTHFHRPRIYIIDTDFQDGGLLLYHRDDNRKLRKDWIKPTLKNLNMVWKGPVYLVSKNWLYGFSANLFKETVVTEVSFEKVVERLRKSEKPFRL